MKHTAGLICAFGIVLAPVSHTHAADARGVVDAAGGQFVVNSFNNCVRTKWLAASDACAAEPRRPRAAAPAVIGQEERTVYFGFNRYALDPEATRRLDSLANTLKSDSQVREAQIVGYADRIGTASYNERLSMHRAENVRRYLVSRGFVKSRVAKTRWLGESVPATQCPDTLSREQLIRCLQKDRRVEVEIEYQK